jgi:hypothetical protein
VTLGVTAEGMLLPDGEFQAEHVLAKAPSGSFMIGPKAHDGG